MLALFDVLEDWFRDPLFYGCPFINAIAESSYASDAAREAATRHKAPLLTWLKAIAIELGRSDPQQFAKEMVVLIDGAIVAAQSARDASFAISRQRSGGENDPVRVSAGYPSSSVVTAKKSGVA